MFALFGAVSPTARGLKTQAATQPDQNNAKDTAVAVARIKNIQPQQVANAKAQQCTRHKAECVRQTFNKQ